MSAHTRNSTETRRFNRSSDQNAHKSEGFRALQKEWYAKLAASGFRDIEQWKLQENGDLEPTFLVDHVGRGRAVATQGRTTQGEELFVVLGRHFHSYRFECFRHRVWVLLYVNGWRGAEIARLFPTTNAKSVTAVLGAFREDALKNGLAGNTELDDDDQENEH